MMGLPPAKTVATLPLIPAIITLSVPLATSSSTLCSPTLISQNYFVRFCSSSIAVSASTTTYISSSIFTSCRDEGPILQDLSFANVIICLTMGVFLAAMLRRTDGHKGWVHELVPMSDYPSLVKIGTLLCRHTDSGG